MNGRPLARRTRTPVHTRRTRPVRRASAGLSTVRAGAALAMLVSAAAIYGVGASPAFDYTKMQLEGVQFTDPAAVEGALSTARGENLFRLSTGPLLAELERLPTVDHARIDVRLPATLAVTIDEREPILVWRSGDARYLAAADGTLLAKLGDAPGGAAAGLPEVVDSRAGSSTLAVGSRLSAVDVDAATRLASLRPADVGSQAVALAIAVTDENGFVLTTKPAGWSAVFGFYTPSLRTTELIPGQVRLLRSLLEGREPQVDRVILASDTDGTYVPRTTPKPSASAKPPKAP
jgi:cell division septal protein FtsQ